VKKGQEILEKGQITYNFGTLTISAIKNTIGE